MARLFADENFPLPVVEVLRRLNHDVITLQEAGYGGQALTDVAVLGLATTDQRALLTINRRHFINLLILRRMNYRHSLLRWWVGVSLVGLVLSHGSLATEDCTGGYADSLRIKGNVKYPLELFLSDLLEYPASAVDVVYYSGSEGLVSRHFTGVPLIELLKTAVIQTDPTVKGDILRKYVVITATDCYKTVLSIADLLPEYGGQQVLVAYADGDNNLLDEEGVAKLVLPGDKRASRYVFNIADIRVRSVP